jgi:hypothetical protein
VENWGDLQEWSEQKSRIGNLKFAGVLIAVVTLFGWAKGLLAAHYPAMNKYTDWFGTALGVLAVFLFVFVIFVHRGHTVRARLRSTPKSLSRR